LFAGATGGGRVSASNAAVVTVAASNNPSGVFAVSSPSIVLADVADGTPAGTRELSFGVSRTAGTFNSVSVVYSVRLHSDVSSDTRRQLVDDVCPSCSLLLAAGEAGRIASVRFTPAIHLEAGEWLVIDIISVAIPNGPASPSPGSEPVIDSAAASVTVEVGTDVADIAVSVAPLLATTTEGSTIEVTVSRGSEQGTMTASWSLVDIAQPGQSIDDLSPSAGTVQMGPGVSSIVIILVVVDDTLSEAAERFTLQLADVQVTRNTQPLSVVLRSTAARITVQESDDARGVFGFGADAVRLAGLLREDAATPLVTLQVERRGGAVGSARVTFRMPDNEDVVVINARAPPAVAGEDPPTDLYIVDFVGGQRSGDVIIRAADDVLPELAESLSLTLVSVETRDVAATSTPSLAGAGGVGAGLLTALTVVVAESDDPHGVIAFAKATQQVNEGDGEARIAVVRLGGLLGDVSVRWVSRPFSGVIDSGVSAGDGDGSSGEGPPSDGAPLDFGGGTGLLTFAEGEDLMFLSVPVYNDRLPEPDETFSIELSEDRGGAKVDGARGVHAVNIAANDNPRGEIAFAAASSFVQEAVGAVRIALVRTGGLFGTATAKWALVVPPGSAFSLTADVTGPLSGQVVFLGNATTASITVQLRDDAVPELAEAFTVVLTAPSAGAILGAITATRVTVDANQDPGGVLGFSCAQSAGVAIDGRVGGTVSLRVLRSQGTIGQVSVMVETTDAGTADATNDFVTASTVLMFAEGEASKEFRFQARALADGSTSRTVVVALRPATVTGGATVDLRRASSIVTLYDSEFTRTVVEQITTAVCDPAGATWCPLCQDAAVAVGGVENAVAGVGGSDGDSAPPKYTQAHVDGIVGVLQQLVPGSGTAAPEVRTLIDSLFSDVVDPANIAEGVDRFAPLPALMDAYAGEVLASLGGAGSMCPGIARRDVGPHITIELRVVSSGLELNGLAVRSSQPAPAVNHTYRLPTALFDATVTGAALDSLACTLMTSVDYRANTWWPVRGAYSLVDERTLESTAVEGAYEAGNGKVISLLPPTAGTISTADPLSFTVPLPAGTLSSHLSAAACAWWDPEAQAGLGAWSTAGCVQVTLAGQRAGEVSCACNHATQFGVLVPSTVKERMPLPGILALVLLAVAALVVMVAHMLHSRFRTDNLALVLQLFLSIFLTAIFALVTVVAANNVSSDGCAALGLILHYFFVSQFAWVLAISANLYMVLVSLQSDLSRHFGKLMVVGWGLPLCIVALYIVVSVAGCDQPFVGGTYGDVTGNRMLCLIPERMVGGWGGTIAAPAALALAFALFVIASSRRHRSEWLTYDDLYFGRPNVLEVGLEPVSTLANLHLSLPRQNTLADAGWTCTLK